MHLVYREDHGNPTDKKYSLSNPPKDTSLEALLKMQAHRYWVERPFQEAKNTVGMDEHQCRLWTAWHPNGVKESVVTFNAGSGSGHQHNMSANFTGDSTSVIQPYLTVIYIIKT